jgi:signal transduction histidine kinase/CheY-like chemotaxis protein/HAMP domain-containing protein
MRWGLKPVILTRIIPILILGSIISVFFNSIMARSNDEKRIQDHILQRRMDLVLLSHLPSLRMYLTNLKLGLDEEAAFVQEDVQLYNLNYLRNLQPSFPHVLSAVSLQGRELLRIKDGKIQAPHQDFSASADAAMVKESVSGKILPLPVESGGIPGDYRIRDVYPVFGEINHQVMGCLVYEYQIPLDELTHHSRNVLFFNLLMGGAIVLIALVIINSQLEIVIKPLNHLTKVSQKMLAGNLTESIRVEGRGETRSLAAAFEALRGRLQHQIQELENNAKELETIIDFLPDATLILDSDKKVLFWNKALEEMTGVSREDLFGKGEMEYALPFYGKKRPMLINLAFEDGSDETIHEEYLAGYVELQHEKNIFSGNAWCSTTRGPKRLLSATACALIDDQGETKGAIECIRDITEHYETEQEKKQLEAQLLHARKMEAVGTLAGGVAHDFNNMLAVILGYAEMLLLGRSETDPQKTDIVEIAKAATRARDLTRQLLAFARKQTLEMKPLDLNSVILGLEKMLRRTLRENVQLEAHLSPNIRSMEGDVGQIEQIILNLAVNAQDAMPEGGALIVETADIVLDEAYALDHEDVTAGPYILMAVGDTGAGMDKQTLDRIFDPFFTTKELGRGTGLGLSTVYGIVKQHGGHITVYSEVGMGTTFRVYFPRSSRTTATTEEQSIERPVRGSETVLIVEDQEQMRAVTCSMLARYGYQVLQAADAETALNLEASHDGPIHLLVTDVVMPGMNGKELCERLLSRRRGVKALYMSGYTTNEIGRHGVLDPAVNFIQKPFSLTGFTSKVREVLDQP